MSNDNLYHDAYDPLGVSQNGTNTLWQKLTILNRELNFTPSASLLIDSGLAPPGDDHMLSMEARVGVQYHGGPGHPPQTNQGSFFSPSNLKRNVTETELLYTPSSSSCCSCPCSCSSSYSYSPSPAPTPLSPHLQLPQIVTGVAVSTGKEVSHFTQNPNHVLTHAYDSSGPGHDGSYFHRHPNFTRGPSCPPEPIESFNAGLTRNHTSEYSYCQGTTAQPVSHQHQAHANLVYQRTEHENLVAMDYSVPNPTLDSGLRESTEMLRSLSYGSTRFVLVVEI